MSLGRLYFGFQGLAGLIWWIGVIADPSIRHLTLGSLPILPVALLDVPLFVGASLGASVGWKPAVWIATGWTLAVTAALFVFALISREATWGFLLMLAASAGTSVAACLILLGRVPSELVVQGPFAFRPTRDTTSGAVLFRTIRQLVGFWTGFLVVLPTAIVWLERRWSLDLDFPLAIRGLGLVIFLAASALGLWSALCMAKVGKGTPLPSFMAHRLVIVGPYRFVRNPMAVAGITQGVSVGLMVSSWFTVLYGLIGSLVWNWVVRPHEEADLAARFGDDFVQYQARVSCWIPKGCFVRKLSPWESREG